MLRSIPSVTHFLNSRSLRHLMHELHAIYECRRRAKKLTHHKANTKKE